MCIAVPMQITEINGQKARACYKGNEIEIDIRLVAPEKGDYVLVHAGCAIEKLREAAARETDALIKELEELARDEG